MPVMAFGAMGRGFFHAYAENRPQRERAFYNLDLLRKICAGRSAPLRFAGVWAVRGARCWGLMCVTGGCAPRRFARLPK
jgi:hypothetical protein